MSQIKWKRVFVVIFILILDISFLGCATSGGQKGDGRWRTSQEGKTTLMIAVENGNFTEVKRLVEVDKVDIDARCRGGAMTTLIGKGGTVSIIGDTKGFKSSNDGHVDIVSTEGLNGNSALSLAILNKETEIVRYLVKAGADKKYNVIYKSAHLGYYNEDIPLRSRNANGYVSYPDEQATILDLARSSGNSEIYDIIRASP